MSFERVKPRAENKAYAILESYTRDLEARLKTVLDERDSLERTIADISEKLADAETIIKSQAEMITMLGGVKTRARELVLEVASLKERLTAVSDGELVLVPRVPTDAMITRAINVPTVHLPKVNFERERMRVRYRAMVNEFIGKHT